MDKNLKDTDQTTISILVPGPEMRVHRTHSGALLISGTETAVVREFSVQLVDPPLRPAPGHVVSACFTGTIETTFVSREMLSLAAAGQHHMTREMMRTVILGMPTGGPSEDQ